MGRGGRAQHIERPASLLCAMIQNGPPSFSGSGAVVRQDALRLWFFSATPMGLGFLDGNLLAQLLRSAVVC
jgi:hypothetical protein